MAAGGSIGAVVGSATTKALVEHVGTINLLILPVVLLQGALFCSRRLAAAAIRSRAGEPEPVAAVEVRASRPVEKGTWSGLRRAFSTPFIALIALYVLFSTFCGTFVYNMQGALARAEYPDRERRTGYFATVDLAVNVLVVGFETMLTARLIAWIGVGAALIILPSAYVFGFSASSMVPMLATVAALEIVRRSIGYGISSPAREVLFTVVPREAKYRAKNVIDTFVWRGGDAAAVWLIEVVLWIGAVEGGNTAKEVSAIAAFGIPVALLWVLTAAALRRRHREAAMAAR
jgi:AAA family ATP:ADP antiporter